MSYIDELFAKIKEEKQTSNRITLASFSNPNLTFYGDFMNDVMSAQKCKISEVGEKMGLERRVFQYVRSRVAKNRREITFFEALRFCVVMNFSFPVSLEYLKLCGYYLNYGLKRDQFISLILNNNHKSQVEENIRLDAINLVEAHYSDLRFDFLKGFMKMNK